MQSIHSILLKDPSRQKELPVTVCCSAQASKCPVIIFSHGAGGSPNYLIPLARFWADHGYVCLMPAHSDSLRLQGVCRTLDDAERQQVINASLYDCKNWQERPADVSFLLDSLPELEQQAPWLEGTIDYLRVGVGGHSLGGHTAQLVAGATIDLPDGRKGCSFADPRVKAVVVLSSTGPGLLGLTTTSWQVVRVPMMTVAGSLDGGAAGQPPCWRMSAFRRAGGTQIPSCHRRRVPRLTRRQPGPQIR